MVHYRSKNEDLEILAKEAIPFSHKISLTDLEEGQEVIKYGELIGKTTRKINAGCLVVITIFTACPVTMKANW